MYIYIYTKFQVLTSKNIEKCLLHGSLLRISLGKLYFKTFPSIFSSSSARGCHCFKSEGSAENVSIAQLLEMFSFDDVLSREKHSRSRRVLISYFGEREPVESSRRS